MAATTGTKEKKKKEEREREKRNKERGGDEQKKRQPRRLSILKDNSALLQHIFIVVFMGYGYVVLTKVIGNMAALLRLSPLG